MYDPKRVAQAKVVGGVGPTFTNNRGFSAVSRSGAGVYVLTLNEECDPGYSVITATRQAAAHGSICYTHLSDSQIQINTFDLAGAAADVSFSIVVDRVFT